MPPHLTKSTTWALANGGDCLRGTGVWGGGGSEVGFSAGVQPSVVFSDCGAGTGARVGTGDSGVAIAISGPSARGGSIVGTGTTSTSVRASFGVVGGELAGSSAGGCSLVGPGTSSALVGNGSGVVGVADAGEGEPGEGDPGPLPPLIPPLFLFFFFPMAPFLTLDSSTNLRA